MNNIQSIKYILVFPKRKHKWKYYLNGNFDDSYSLKTSDLKDFIFSVCDSSISSDLNQHLTSFTPFLIDVENKKVRTISIDLEKAKENFSKEFWKNEKKIDTALKNY